MLCIMWRGLPFCFSTGMMFASTFVLQMLHDPVPLPRERESEQRGDISAGVPTPPTPCRPLESFESLPAADPGSARPISTLVIRGQPIDISSRGRNLAEP